MRRRIHTYTHRTQSEWVNECIWIPNQKFIVISSSSSTIFNVCMYFLSHSAICFDLGRFLVCSFHPIILSVNCAFVFVLVQFCIHIMWWHCHIDFLFSLHRIELNIYHIVSYWINRMIRLNFTWQNKTQEKWSTAITKCTKFDVVSIFASNFVQPKL